MRKSDSLPKLKPVDRDPSPLNVPNGTRFLRVDVGSSVPSSPELAPESADPEASGCGPLPESAVGKLAPEGRGRAVGKAPLPLCTPPEAGSSDGNGNKLRPLGIALPVGKMPDGSDNVSILSSRPFRKLSTSPMLGRPVDSPPAGREKDGRENGREMDGRLGSPVESPPAGREIDGRLKLESWRLSLSMGAAATVIASPKTVLLVVNFMVASIVWPGRWNWV